MKRMMRERRKKRDRFWLADVSSRRKCLAHFLALCAWELFLAPKGRSNGVHKFPEHGKVRETTEHFITSSRNPQPIW